MTVGHRLAPATSAIAVAPRARAAAALRSGESAKRFVDQLVELRVAIGLPPRVRGPVGLGRGEALGVGVGGRRLNARRLAEVRRAAGEGEKGERKMGSDARVRATRRASGRLAR